MRPFPIIFSFVVMLFGFTPSATAYRLSFASPPPDWSALDAWQGTMSREAFLHRLETVYAPGGASSETIRVEATAAYIRTRASQPHAYYRLAFAEGGGAEVAAKPVIFPGGRLAGSHIVIDPGHIGGDWAELEQRSFRIGDDPPVREGDWVLLVAQRLRHLLEAEGVQVTLVREANEPVTSARPADFFAAAAQQLGRPAPETGEEPKPDIRRRAELLFYRSAEIRARADLIDRLPQPADLILCLHINAAAWPDPENPSLVDEDHLHILVNGAYSREELALDDQRWQMLRRLLRRLDDNERIAARALADAMAEKTGLPPFTYRSPVAVNIDGHPYIWARNLAANRLFDGPVLFLEPWVANSHSAYARLQMGHYEGHRMIDGEPRLSIVEEYAQSVLSGLRRLAAEPPPTPEDAQP
ncbi:MAG: N-acetylmuramoyl-L-alanine amidase [Opitutales bacterium]|nr:N-acetylmuramoyl-L-alanine amidase [Opitutales bacterium]